MKTTFLAIAATLIAIGTSAAQVPEVINLPAPSIERSSSLVEALRGRKSGREYGDEQLQPQHLSNLLWCANGINRPESGNRTSPSARNARDTDVYVILKEGAYLYEPVKNLLILISSGDFRKNAGMQPYVATAPLNLVYVSDTARLGFIKDREELVLTAGIDAGHCSQNVYLYAAATGLSTVTRTSVDRGKMAAILKLKPNQLVIMGQTVGHAK
jgi:SagB-type dehydrogenase family enzyme